MIQVEIVFKSGSKLVVHFRDWNDVRIFLSRIVDGEPFVYDDVFINPAEVAGAGAV